MKPLCIEICNIGAITHSKIDLTGVNIAAISGVNGAGKTTAFTIAPRFALYGATKAGTRVDDMVRTGTTEMSVTFDFEHQGGIWRVARTRSTKGKGKSTLELQRKSGNQWVKESGNSIDETQKKIIDLLGLDDETFVASSMILQGDAGNFTKRPAGQRKAILSQVLQLDQYEILQEKAKAKAQAVNVELEKSKSKVFDIDARLAEQPSIEAEKMTIEVNLVNISTAINQSEIDLQKAQVEHASLIARIEQADNVKQQADISATEIASKSIERDRQQIRLNNAQKLVDQEPTIIAKVTEYELAKEKVTILKVKRDQHSSLIAESNRLKTELAGVETGLNKTVDEIKRIETTLADRSRLESIKTEYDQAVSRLAECQKDQQEDQRLHTVAKEAEDKLLLAEDRYKNQETNHKQLIASLEAKTAMLADANCVDIERAQCKFLADAISAKAELVTLQQQYQEWKIEADQIIATAQTELKSVQQSRSDYRTRVGLNPLEPYELQEKIKQLNPDCDLLAQLSAMEPLLENLRTQRIDLESRQTDINTNLKTKGEQYKAITDDVKELPELELKVMQLEPWLKSKEQLPAAKEIATTAQAAINGLNTELESLTLKEATLRLEYASLIGDAVELRITAEEKLQTAQEALKQHRDEHLRLTAQMGGIQAKLDAMALDTLLRQSLAAEMEPQAKALVRWQQLIKAFGRDGIPALIIENAVPELERIANDILGQMSGGKNYLRFETQRELKSRQGMAETLDIIVGDWAGERIYETFSGGEQLRIDFAIRFALAELLARRAGAKVDWLTIDEGFGSQSDEFLPMVIDAVKTVAHRFGIVLVISHVKAVQEAFEQKIEFLPSSEEGEPTEVKVA